MAYSDTRWVIKLAAAGAAMLASAAAQSQNLPDLKGKNFIFAGFGGDLQNNQDVAWLQPFAAATGVKIEQTSSPDFATIKTQQEAQNVGEDVIEIESNTVDANCGTVFIKAEIDRSQLNPQYDKNRCGVPVVKFSLVLAYNAKKFPNPPTSVADFFDTTKYPGSRAVSNVSNSGILETALLADGVDPSKIYPIDLERALKKIKSARDFITTVGTYALMQDGLANGEYDMALLPNGRAMNAANTNSDIKATFGNAVTLYDDLAIPTGAKNVAAATAFLQYVAMHKTQVALSERFPYGLGTVGEAPKLSVQAKAFFPDTFTDKLLVQDPGWWSANDGIVKDRLTNLFSQ